MYRDIWLVMLILSLLLFFLAIILIFVWRVPDIIDELSGRKAKRQIKMMHEVNISTENIDKMSTNEIYSSIHSGSLVSEGSVVLDDVIDTSDMFFKEDFNSENSTTVMESESSTSYMGDESETSFMEDGLKDFEDVSNISCNSGISIIVIEEQSSF